MSRDPRRDPPQAGGLAFTFVALVLIFTGLGYLLDRWLHTGPWVMVGGVFVGFGLALFYVASIPFGGKPGGRRGKPGGRRNGKTGDGDGPGTSSE